MSEPISEAPSLQAQLKQAPRKRMNPAKRKKVALWMLFGILAMSVLLPLGSYSVHWLGQSAIAQQASGGENQRSEFWREVRGGSGGYSAVKGEGANMLVQSGGNDWRLLRNGPVQKYLPYALGAMVVLIALYHLIFGRNKLDHARSGRKVKRWNVFERFVHWVTAISFIALTITGMSMLFGRTFLIPLLGAEGFSLWAQLSITVHNVIGPVFSVGIALMILMWIWINFPTVTDLKWFAKGGGLFGKSHASAGRLNGGEKVWFWIIATVGVAVCLSGIVLLAPIYGYQVPILMEVRAMMQQANLIHVVAGGAWVTVAIGHIYIGTAGTEGAFEGMATGYVSEEWAKQHHDLWYADVAKKAGADGYATRAELDVMRRENEAAGGLAGS